VHSNADFPRRAAAPKPGNLRIPLAVLEHLPDLHGAEFKVLLVLGRHQARGGGRDRKPFPYTIPQIMEDTGLCPRAISQAISRLDQHHLILRVKKRVLLDPVAPAAMMPPATSVAPGGPALGNPVAPRRYDAASAFSGPRQPGTRQSGGAPRNW
jgi:hypothetical protein